jgi:hypothetical protein
MLLAALAGMLARTRPARRQCALEPAVDLLLDVDREYREKTERGALPKIAPRRFNPSGESWLPILHTERADWRFTALFSNTALAHELGRARLGGDLFPPGQRTGGAAYGRHGIARAACRPPRGPGSRGGMLHAARSCRRGR